MRERGEKGPFLTGHRKREKKTPGKEANTSLALPEIGLPIAVPTRKQRW